MKGRQLFLFLAAPARRKFTTISRLLAIHTSMSMLKANNTREVVGRGSEKHNFKWVENLNYFNNFVKDVKEF